MNNRTPPVFTPSGTYSNPTIISNPVLHQPDTLSEDLKMDTACWWKHGVIYQIYPRSFQDTNGDGIGDLRGLIQRLDYLNDGTSASLGVDAIWLSPFFVSPMADFGYDISDYRAIDPDFGTMDDFDELLREAHRRGIRIILDLVLNHTSDQHPWFTESSTPGSDKADWYLWYEGKDRPNNWLSCFGGKGWTWHPERQAWYFHSFLAQQPDLNWRNPNVKAAMKSLMEFWLDKGVDGFRLDVVNLYLKDEQLRSNPRHWWRVARPYDQQRHIHDRDQPELHSLYREMRQWVDQYSDRMVVGEIMIADTENARLPASYCGTNDELHLTFNFELLRAPFRAKAFRTIVRKWVALLGEKNWPNYTLSNHDFPRHISRHTRFYHSKKEAQHRARLMACALLTLRGTPFLYYGEEIGMPEQSLPRHQLQDPAGKHYWPLYSGRDGCRRPMMWQAPDNTFSTGDSWLPDAPLPGHNVEDQTNDPDSLLNWYRTLIWLRKRHSALHKGDLTMLKTPSQVLAYERSGDENNNDRLMIVLNFSRRPGSLILPQNSVINCLANSHGQNIPTPCNKGLLQLHGYQALILKLTENRSC